MTKSVRRIYLRKQLKKGHFDKQIQCILLKSQTTFSHSHFENGWYLGIKNRKLPLLCEFLYSGFAVPRVPVICQSACAFVLINQQVDIIMHHHVAPMISHCLACPISIDQLCIISFLEHTFKHQVKKHKRLVYITCRSRSIKCHQKSSRITKKAPKNENTCKI